MAALLTPVLQCLSDIDTWQKLNKYRIRLTVYASFMGDSKFTFTFKEDWESFSLATITFSGFALMPPSPQDF